MPNSGIRSAAIIKKRLLQSFYDFFSSQDDLGDFMLKIDLLLHDVSVKPNQRKLLKLQHVGRSATIFQN